MRLMTTIRNSQKRIFGGAGDGKGLYATRVTRAGSPISGGRGVGGAHLLVHGRVIVVEDRAALGVPAENLRRAAAPLLERGVA
jgi:hypothetical protein